MKADLRAARPAHLRSRSALPAFALIAYALLAVACGGEAPPSDEPTPRITLVEAASPIVVGTVLRIVGLDLDRLGSGPVLQVRTAARVVSLRAVPHDVDDELLYEVPDTLIDAVGDGEVHVELWLEGARQRSEPYSASWELAGDLPLLVERGIGGEVYRNGVAVLDGDGFPSPSEGTCAAVFEGTFVRDDDGASSPIEVRLPIAPAERLQRNRGVLVLTTDVGGLWPGTFTGTMTVESELTGGGVHASGALETTLHFNPPELYQLVPDVASIGQVLRIDGAGFLGGADRSDEATLFRIQGTFTPEGGGPSVEGTIELVPEFVSGSEARLTLGYTVQGGRLVATAFGAARGVFEGTSTPITIDGTDEVAGPTIPFQLTLGPVRQIVHLQFLPGFYTSLEHFGLASAAPVIEERIVERIESIYEAFLLDIRLEEPTDFDRSAYGSVEIGGPDPNGNGLFGYDNSPGKDVGNLRLHDQIGGANAETQMDGSPGYGGVFVESMLWWSQHPDLPVARPAGSPDPDPLFDELFDPVRRRPATFAEVSGEGSPDRLDEVERAIDALASIIGETTAHEIGHSLGMAQPYGGPNDFHNDIDGDGCLMDRGGERPIGERAQQPGFARTQFCYDEPDYLSEILGP